MAIKKKRGEHYVSNADLFTAICEYQLGCREAAAAGKTKPQVSRYIGECIVKIASRLAHKPNWSGYSYRDEMVADAVENMFSYGVEKFDPTRTQNPFAYFTQIAWNAFRLRVQKEKKQSYIKYKQMENMYVTGEWADHQEGDDAAARPAAGGMSSAQGGQAASYREHVNDFVQKYEDSIEAKKVKKRQGALDKLIEDGGSDVVV